MPGEMGLFALTQCANGKKQSLCIFATTDEFKSFIWVPMLPNWAMLDRTSKNTVGRSDFNFIAMTAAIFFHQYFITVKQVTE